MNARLRIKQRLRQRMKQAALAVAAETVNQVTEKVNQVVADLPWRELVSIAAANGINTRGKKKPQLQRLLRKVEGFQ